MIQGGGERGFCSRAVRRGCLFHVWPFTYFPFSTTFLCLCLDLCLWPLRAMNPGTGTSIDQDPTSVPSVLLPSQGQWCLFPDCRGRRLVLSWLLQPLHTPLSEQGHDGAAGSAQRNANRMCVRLWFPPGAFTPPKRNYFINSCHCWQTFLQPADSFIGATRKLRQTPGNTPFWSPVSPTLTAILHTFLSKTRKNAIRHACE